MDFPIGVIILSLLNMMVLAAGNFCSHVTQLHQQCTDQNGLTGNMGQGRPGKMGPPGPPGNQGPPGTVDYDVIERQLATMFGATENRLNRKLSRCEEKLESLEEALRSHTTTDCGKVLIEDAKSTDRNGGIFDIYLRREKLEVYCDLETDGGGWLVFQRRKDGSENFYRNWNDYVSGFGDKLGEFWLGLEKLHKITASGRFELRVDLEDWSGERRYARYSSFKVGSSSTQYTLDLGAFSGNATDSMTRENRMKFSTKDLDNDVTSANCAQLYKGAWWYGKCHVANLNGYYYKGGPIKSYADGVIWESWKGYHYSLKFSEMKIRPI